MKAIRKILSELKTLLKSNVLKTIYFNFKVLPFSQAIHLPFILYGKVYFGDLSGSVEIPKIVSFGMIKIGYKWIDMWPLSFLPTQIQFKGKLMFEGECIISGGANINVQSKEGTLTIGKCVVIGGGSVVKCMERIEVGENTRITGNCNIMDCNMHFVKNITTGVVNNYKGSIIIGKNCWINYGTIVTKGAVIPDYSISTRGAFISKDFSEEGTNLFLVGSPAKPGKTKVQRIFSWSKQKEFAAFFRDNNVESLQLEPGLESELNDREGFYN